MRPMLTKPSWTAPGLRASEGGHVLAGTGTLGYLETLIYLIYGAQAESSGGFLAWFPGLERLLKSDLSFRIKSSSKTKSRGLCGQLPLPVHLYKRSGQMEWEQIYFVNKDNLTLFIFGTKAVAVERNCLGSKL